MFFLPSDKSKYSFKLRVVLINSISILIIEKAFTK